MDMVSSYNASVLLSLAWSRFFRAARINAADYLLFATLFTGFWFSTCFKFPIDDRSNFLAGLSIDIC